MVSSRASAASAASPLFSLTFSAWRVHLVMRPVLFLDPPALSPSLVLACEGWEWERFKAKQKEGKKLAKSLKGAAFRLHDSPRMVT